MVGVKGQLFKFYLNCALTFTPWHSCINKPFWQNGGITSLELCIKAIPDTQIPSRIVPFFIDHDCNNYMSLVSYRGAKIKLHKK